MLPVLFRLPAPHRHLPRSRPGTGPTSKRDAALLAEVTHLSSQLVKLEREQQTQLHRIAQIQQELDDVKRILKTIADR